MPRKFESWYPGQQGNSDEELAYLDSEHPINYDDGSLEGDHLHGRHYDQPHPECPNCQNPGPAWHSQEAERYDPYGDDDHGPMDSPYGDSERDHYMNDLRRSESSVKEAALPFSEGEVCPACQRGEIQGGVCNRCQTPYQPDEGRSEWEPEQIHPNPYYEEQTPKYWQLPHQHGAAIEDYRAPNETGIWGPEEIEGHNEAWNRANDDTHPLVAEHKQGAHMMELHPECPICNFKESQQPFRDFEEQLGTLIDPSRQHPDDVAAREQAHQEQDPEYLRHMHGKTADAVSMPPEGGLQGVVEQTPGGNGLYNPAAANAIVENLSPQAKWTYEQDTRRGVHPMTAVQNAQNTQNKVLQEETEGRNFEGQEVPLGTFSHHVAGMKGEEEVGKNPLTEIIDSPFVPDSVVEATRNLLSSK